jgi:uncharacterized protein
LIGGRPAEAASFDCRKAAGRVERLICDDPVLNVLDTQLAAAFAGALDRSSPPAGLKRQHRTWLQTRERCGDAACLTAAYERQIATLAGVSDTPPACHGATTPEINACAAEYSRRADNELRRYLAAARQRLATRDEEDPESKAALAGLDASQAAWEAYRKAECEAVYSWWSGGTIRGAMYQGCWRALTRDRTRAIWEAWLHHTDTTPPLLPEPVGD